MTALEYAFQIAGLDLDSVKDTAGRVALLIAPGPRGRVGRWYRSTDEVERPPLPTAFIDIWAIKPKKHGKGTNPRADFVLKDTAGGVVVDSKDAPDEQFYAYTFPLTLSQYDELRKLESGDISHATED